MLARDALHQPGIGVTRHFHGPMVGGLNTARDGGGRMDPGELVTERGLDLLSTDSWLSLVRAPRSASDAKETSSLLYVPEQSPSVTNQTTP